MLKISGRLCVVFGGGAVAERKAAGLLEAGAKVRVVSPDATAGLRERAAAGRLEWIAREAAESDVQGAFLVFAATSSPEVNRRMAAAAGELGVPANVADDGEAGDFLVPAVLRRGEFILAAGVSGAGPALAARVARELAERYGPEYAEYAELLRRIRQTVKEHVTDGAERRRLLMKAARPESLTAWRMSGLPHDPAEIVRRLRSEDSGAGSDQDTR